jgi:hypothetical protein
MTVNAGDAAAYPLSGASVERYIGSASFTIGSSGAIASTVADDAKIAGDDFGSGVCNLTYPACSTVRLELGVVSDGTITGCVATALTPSSGTAVLKTTAGGAATEPEADAVIMVRIFGVVTP